MRNFFGKVLHFCKILYTFALVINKCLIIKSKNTTKN